MSDQLVILLSSVGAIQSYFLAIYIFSLGRKNVENVALGAIFLALAIRVSKSILWAFWNGTPLWLINLGFAAHASIGPLFLLYFYQTLPGAKFNKLNLLHLLPACLIIIFAFQLPLIDFWYTGGYSILLYHQLVYMIAGLVLFLRIASKTHNIDTHWDKEKFTWIRNLWIGIFIWQLAYFSNYILGLTSYFLGPVLYSGLIYVVSFYGLRHQNVLRKKHAVGKYKNLNLSKQEITRYKNKVIQFFNDEKPYLDSDFNLSKLSAQLSIPSHILSYVFNDAIKLNFSEFINSYRIENARQILSDPSQQHLKIASIAYDSGFNSLSSFNTAFKKQLDITPSDFRENHSDHKRGLAD